MNHLGQLLVKVPVELHADGAAMPLYARVMSGHGAHPEPDHLGTKVTARLDHGRIVDFDVAKVKRVCSELELERSIVAKWPLRCPVCSGQGEAYRAEPNEYGGTRHIIEPCEACGALGLDTSKEV